jgi:hypothetical protein
MSAVSSSAATPLFPEGTAFWQELIENCKRNVEAINSCVRDHGLEGNDLIVWRPGKEMHIAKVTCPSTEIRANITFHSWGPVISGTITGWEYEDTRFLLEEFEFPIAKDLDGEVVAIFDEGRSFSPRDLACYLAQKFHRCYPGIALPC